MTPEQASCVAVVRAYGHIKDPVKAWQGWMRHLGMDNTTPEATQKMMLAEVAPRGTDPMNVRLERLRHKGLYAMAVQFTTLCHPERLHHQSPVDLIGAAPDDFPGQCALIYQLRRMLSVPYASLAYAFSVPYTELGERLLIGEQLHLAHDPVDEMARKAIQAP